MDKSITYLSEIIIALEILDGMGTLTEINQEIINRGMLSYINTNYNWKDNVRATIQRHCSQTKSFHTSGGKTEQDIFYSVYGLGEGVWGLRSFLNIKIDNIDITPFESRQVKNIINDKYLHETEKQTIIMSRKGQGKFRRLLLKRDSKCIITGIENEELLVASHIKPWRSSTNSERLDSNNGILLSLLYDKLFDRGYITFTDDTRILISPELSIRDKDIIQIDINKKFIPNCSYEMRMFINYHNNNVFRK